MTSIRRNQRGPGKKPAKVVSLRLDPLVVSTFKARGKYWQRDINETLLRAVKRRRASPRSRLESLLGASFHRHELEPFTEPRTPYSVSPRFAPLPVDGVSPLRARRDRKLRSPVSSITLLAVIAPSGKSQKCCAECFERNGKTEANASASGTPRVDHHGAIPIG